MRRVPEDLLTERSADPAWRRAVGMRHRIAHEYDAVDHEILWSVVSRHAGELRARIEEILSGSGDGSAV